MAAFEGDEGNATLFLGRGQVFEPAADAAPAVDHVAFAYDALDEALARLDRMNLRYTRPTLVPGTQIRQCFVKDPNGVTVELQGP